MTKKVMMILTDGFEETEAVGTGDVLKRLGCQVVMTGLEKETVRSSAGLRICADAVLSSVKDLTDFDAVILPGGLPGATTLRDSAEVMETVRKFAAAGKITAAICAAPIALAQAGVTDGKIVTGYPGSEKLSGKDLKYSGSRTEISGNIVTAKGPGVSFEFGAAVARALGLEQKRIDEVLDTMFVRR